MLPWTERSLIENEIGRSGRAKCPTGYIYFDKDRRPVQRGKKPETSRSDTIDGHGTQIRRVSPILSRVETFLTPRYLQTRPRIIQKRGKRKEKGSCVADERTGNLHV